MDFQAYGKKIPLAYTMYAKKELLKVFGDGESIAKAFAVADESELASNMAKIGSVLSKAYSMRQKALVQLTGEEDDSCPIEEENLFAILDRDLTIQLVGAITKTVAEANKTTVEVAPEKKEEAMQ